MVWDKPDPILEDDEFNRAILGGKEAKRVNVPILFDRHKMLEVAQILRALADEINADLRGPVGAAQPPMRTSLLSVGWQIDQANRRFRILRDQYERELREAREAKENVVQMRGHSGTAE